MFHSVTADENVGVELMRLVKWQKLQYSRQVPQYFAKTCDVQVILRVNIESSSLMRFAR